MIEYISKQLIWPLFSYNVMFLSVLLCVVTGLLSKSWRKKETLVTWIFVLIVFCFCLLEEFAYSNSQVLWVHNLYSIFEIIGLTALFLVIISEKRKLIFIAGVILLLILIGEIWNIGELNSNTPISGFLSSLVFIAISILGFYSLFVNEEDPDILQNPSFWILSGLLIYMTAALFSLGLKDRILTNEESAIKGLWDIHNYFNAIRYILFSIGFLVLPRPSAHKNLSVS